MSAKKDGRSGRILVLSMIIGAVILALIAVEYRKHMPQNVIPVTEPTSDW